MPERDKSIRRGADIPGTYLEIMISHDGDIYLTVKGQDKKGRINDEVQLEFIAPNGGGYHPRTIEALCNLAKAIEKDNNDPLSPERYKFP